MADEGPVAEKGEFNCGVFTFLSFPLLDLVSKDDLEVLLQQLMEAAT